MKREVVLSSKWQETGEKKERRSKKRWEHPRKGTELGVKAPPPHLAAESELYCLASNSVVFHLIFFLVTGVKEVVWADGKRASFCS